MRLEILRSYMFLQHNLICNTRGKMRTVDDCDKKALGRVQDPGCCCGLGEGCHVVPQQLLNPLSLMSRTVTSHYCLQVMMLRVMYNLQFLSWVSWVRVRMRVRFQNLRCLGGQVGIVVHHVICRIFTKFNISEWRGLMQNWTDCWSSKKFFRIAQIRFWIISSKYIRFICFYNMLIWYLREL